MATKSQFCFHKLLFDQFYRTIFSDASQNDDMFESCSVKGESKIYSGPSLEPGGVAVGTLGTDHQSELQFRYKPGKRQDMMCYFTNN